MVTDNQQTAELSDVQLRSECLAWAIKSPDATESLIELASKYFDFVKGPAITVVTDISDDHFEEPNAPSVRKCRDRKPIKAMDRQAAIDCLVDERNKLADELRDKAFDAMLSNERPLALRRLDLLADRVKALNQFIEERFAT